MAHTAEQNLNLESSVLPETPAHTWILFAHRSEACLYASDGGVKNFRFLNRIPHPEGRLHDHELTTDRDGATKSEGGANYPRLGGLVNKGEATLHETQLFAKQLSEILRKGRTQNLFSRLALFAEPRFLGEIRSSLDGPTAALVVVAVDKEFRDAPDERLKEKIKPHLMGSMLAPLN